MLVNRTKKPDFKFLDPKIQETFKCSENMSGPAIESNGDIDNHEMNDTLENLNDSVGNIIGLFKDQSEEEVTERGNALEALHVSLFSVGHGKRTFRIEAHDFTHYGEL